MNTRWISGVCALLSAALVQACTPVAPGADTAALPGVGALDSDPLVIGDAPDLFEAPELFNLSAVAVWDGIRTVPGVWVAHPTAKQPIDVRIVNTRTGVAVEGRLFPAERRSGSDDVVVSSEAAAALAMDPGRRARLAITALVPGDLATMRHRQTAEKTARSALTGYAATLDHDRLAQLVGALMRGMGYRTDFEDGRVAADGGSGIRAHLASEGPVGSIHVAVRAGGGQAFSGAELAAFGGTLDGTQGVGLVVSVPGFESGVRQGGVAGGAFVDMLDLEGLLDLWVERYEDMAERDRALMPLKPVYFLAAN